MQLPLIFCSVATLLAACWASDQGKQPEVGTALAAGNFLYSRLRRHSLLGFPISLGDDKKSKNGRGMKKNRKNDNLLGGIVALKGISLLNRREEDSIESTEQQTKQDRPSKAQSSAAQKSTAAPPATTESVNLSKSTAEASKEPSIAETAVQVPSTTDTTVQETLSTEIIVEETSTTGTTAPETSTTAPESSATETTTEETSTTERIPATTLAPDQISTSEDSAGTDATDESGSMKLVKSESRPQAGQESRSIGAEMGTLFDQQFNQMQALFSFDQLAGQDSTTPKPADVEDAYAKLSYSPPANPSSTYQEIIIRQMPEHEDRRLADSPRLSEPPGYPSWSNKPVPSTYSSYVEKKTVVSDFDAVQRAKKLPTIPPPRPPAKFDYDGEDPFFTR